MGPISFDGHSILDIVGDLIAHVGQFMRFLPDQWIVGLVRQFSTFFGFLSK